ncbi:hypothetical protein CQA66_01225 [Helicobacter aurati]|uniref:Band 7 domain-containing protein n=1 Tax=Helicobacter aurati TaxID=137778 RepID=A0A3D8J757_9HELI|nr:SPFH domain-containing protein [Helicobacter aurati]RDU73319.1 hypothetical protein CQA66_01225 [Helicobacter aurati]
MPIDLNEHRNKHNSQKKQDSTTPQNKPNNTNGNNRNNKGFNMDSLQIPPMPSGKLLTVILIFVVVILIFLLAKPFMIVNDGEVGIKVHLGKYEDIPLNPGLHFFIPVIEDIITVDTRVRAWNFSRNEDAIGSGINAQSIVRSKAIDVIDVRGLPVSIELTVQYQLDRSKVPQTFREYGYSWEQKIINAKILDVVRSVVGNYPAEDLPNKRDEVANAIIANFQGKLDATPNKPVKLDSIQLREIVLPPLVKEKIEQVQAAKQEAERAKQEANAARERAQGKADANIIEAKGQAEANRLVSDSLSARLLELRQVEIQGKFNDALKENKDAQIFLTPGGAVPNIWVDSKSKQRTTISNQ